MKRFLTLTLTILVMSILATASLLAFQVDPEAPQVAGWMEVLNSLFGEYFTSVGGFTAAIITLSSFLFEVVLKDKVTKNTHKRLITMAISLVLGIGAHFLGFGVFAGMEIAAIFMLAINVSFGSNGIFSFFKDIFKKKDTENA